MKKLIETALPLRVLSQSAMSDKVRKGHPGNMHLWWNRSPIDSSAALLKAAVTDADTEEFGTAIHQLENMIAGEVFLQMKMSHPPAVCDPFSGFGGLTIAAQKAGLDVYASDLNAVATILTKAVAEIPSRFGDCKPINPQAENKIFFGAEGLASDVDYYGELLKRETYKKIGEHYKDVQLSETDKAPVYAWVWIRTMKCPNPACGCQIPMASSYILSKLKGHEFWAEPEIVDKKVRFKIHEGVCPQEKESNKHGSNGSKFQCPACGEITKDEYVKADGKSGGLHMQMMAVSVLTKSGRVFVEPDVDQIMEADVPMVENPPIGSLPDNTRWFSPPGFGITEYADLYTPRQLLLLTTLCDLIPNIQKKAYEDAIGAGMSGEDVSLKDGGNGALAYSQAISVYLALVIGKLANFQSTVCTWDNRNGNIRAAFTRQAIPMTWVFAEGNPFSTPTGNYDSMLKNVVESIEKLYIGKTAVVKQESALTVRFPENSILFTELPYYDNVGYADLSDYFYIWMRRCMKDVYPELFEKVVTSKEELSSIPEHYGGNAEKAVEAYRRGLKELCCHFAGAASEEYSSIIFYEYSKQDELMIKTGEETGKEGPLEYLLKSLYEAGFMITGLWPVRTEKPNARFDSLRIAIVFRKRASVSQATTRRGVINTIKRELPEILNIAFSVDIDEFDKPIAGLGLGLSIFSRYGKVINADGTTMCIHDALMIVYQEVKDYIIMTTDDDSIENTVTKED